MFALQKYLFHIVKSINLLMVSAVDAILRKVFSNDILNFP